MTPETNHHFIFQYDTEKYRIVAENVQKAIEGFSAFVGKPYEELKNDRKAALLEIDGKPV